MKMNKRTMAGKMGLIAALAAGVMASAFTAEAKDVVNVGVEQDPADLSPFGPGTTGRTPVIDILYETLGCIGTDGEFVGVLSKDYELSEDETTLTFHLYDNIYDTAGNHITASDVVFSYESKAATGNLFNIAFIQGCEAVDDYTVQFNLNPPLNLTNIANLVNNLYIVSEQAYNDSEDGMVTGGVVSTSHYVVEDYEGGYMLTLTKNEDYWQSEELTAPRSQANVDTINYYVLNESNQRTMALESGTIDMCWSITSADISKFEEGGEKSDSYWVYEASDNLSNVLVFNQADGHVTQDAGLRRAIGYSISNELLAQSIFGGHGEGNYDFSRKTTAGFNESWLTEDNFYQYDLEAAAAALADSAYSGESIVLLCNTDATITDTAAMIQGFCAQAGINIEINSVDSATINTYFADASQWDIYLTQSAAETYCVQSWIRHLDNSSSGTTTGFLADDTLQALLTEAANVETSTQEAIDACHDYIADNAIVYGLGNPYVSYVLPSDCTDVILGYKLEVLPGACTYAE